MSAKIFIRVFIVLSLLLFLSGIAVSYFGVNYEIAKIPPDIRSQMSDTDWVGVEWIGIGAVLFAVAFSFMVLSTIIYFFKR